MLPFWNGSGLASPKYGNIATEQLISKLIGFGSKKEDLIAKVFGGANQTNSTLTIGDRNYVVAEELLREHGIPIKAKSVGGTRGRKIIFNTATGEVVMKYVTQQVLR